MQPRFRVIIDETSEVVQTGINRYLRTNVGMNIVMKHQLQKGEVVTS